jgi:hypothetical protein
MDKLTDLELDRFALSNLYHQPLAIQTLIY